MSQFFLGSEERNYMKITTVKIFLCFLICFMLAGCDLKTKMEVSKDLKETFQQISVGEFTEIKVLNPEKLYVVDEHDDNEYINLILSNTDYEINDIEIIDEDKCSAHIEIDTVAAADIMKEVASRFTEFDMDRFMEEYLQELKSTKEKKTYDVTVELQKVDGSWLIVPDWGLNDAMTGGLLSLYAETARSQYERLLEEAGEE